MAYVWQFIFEWFKTTALSCIMSLIFFKFQMYRFDHTCPWTGTAIGKKNMPAFQAFIFFLFACLIMDIALITAAAV